MPFPPNLYLIGAQKAGTTFLATLLGQHDDICLADPKEPHYFTQHWGSGEDWYRGFFSDASKRFLLDASPSYSAAPLTDGREAGEAPHRTEGVPQRIAEKSPEARFIYLMRDPVKRAHSSYWHSVRAGNERRPIGEALRADSTYLRMGCYHYQLERYFEHFERERFLLLFFEDFVNNPQTAANHCFQWLGLEPLADFHLSKGKNESYTYGPFLSTMDKVLARVGGLKYVAKRAKKILPHRMLQALRQSMTQKVPPLDAVDRDWLLAYYSEPNQLLERNLGMTHSDWIHK